MTTGEIIKKLRKERKLTQMQLAAISGVSQQAISFLENGRNTAGEATLRLLANALGCTISELLGEAKPVSEPADREKYLLFVFRQLNEKGQDDLLAYAEFCLTRLPKQEKTTASAV